MTLPDTAKDTLSIQHFLDKSMEHLSDKGKYDIYELSSISSVCDPIVSQLDGMEVTSCIMKERLILTTQIVSTSGEEVFVSGIIAQEYQCKFNHTEKTIICIDKVDTTGLQQKPHNQIGITRLLVSAYLAYLRCRFKNWMMYLCAKAKTQYIFADSADNQSKLILKDYELIKWWTRTLDLENVKLATGRDYMLKYLFVPGESRSNYPCTSPTQGTTKWLWGSPFDDKTKASDVIPRFKDDVQARVLEGSECQELTVAAFWQYLSITEECSSRTGLIYLTFGNNSNDDKGEVDWKEGNEIDIERFVKLTNKLCNISFAPDDAVDATLAVLEEFDKLEIGPIKDVETDLLILAELTKRQSPKVQCVTTLSARKKVKTSD